MIGVFPVNNPYACKLSKAMSLTRSKLIFLGSAVVAVPVAFGVGLYLGIVMDRWRARSGREDGTLMALRAEEKRLMDEQAAISQKIREGALKRRP